MRHMPTTTKAARTTRFGEQGGGSRLGNTTDLFTQKRTDMQQVPLSKQFNVGGAEPAASGKSLAE